ncbi:MAG TPA: PilZ domain-containing protein [Phycisphaerales bacterium]|jgi:hypothetical protein|nr:PilZ domain-containing protein [Phycisphaerales bacterium]
MAGNERTAPSGKLAKAGMSFLKRLVFEEATLEADNRREDARTPVVGEVQIHVLDASGQTTLQTRVFVRDLSKGGCGLWSRVRVESGSQIVIQFPPTNGAPPLARKALVCHCRGQDGAGFALGCRFMDAGTAEK